MGHARSKHNGIFCDLPLCTTDIPAVANEARDAVFQEFVSVLSHEVAPTAELLGISRQRAYQILKERAL